MRGLRNFFQFNADRDTLAPRVFVMLIAALGLILLSSFAYGAADTDPLSPPFDTCYVPLSGKNDYLTGLQAEGWTDADDRIAAMARLIDAFLPINAPQPTDWAGMMDYRSGAAAADAMTLMNGRAILEQDGATLLLAGYMVPDGRLQVECAIALADDRLTNDFFEGTEADIGHDADEELNAEEDHDHIDLNGYRMVTYSGIVEGDDAEATIYVMQLVPESDPVPPLAASNGVLTRLTFPAPSN